MEKVKKILQTLIDAIDYSEQEENANHVITTEDKNLLTEAMELINENDCIDSISQHSELLAFKRFISKTPLVELELYSDEEFTDLYLKANCG